MRTRGYLWMELASLGLLAAVGGRRNASGYR